MTHNSPAQHAAIQQIVIDTLSAILVQRGTPPPPTLDRDTPIFGLNGLLDSIGVVTLMVDLEQNLSDRLSLAVRIADDRAMSQRSSPFRTVGTLTDFIASQLAETA
jgi:acyl carrier protein